VSAQFAQCIPRTLNRSVLMSLDSTSTKLSGDPRWTPLYRETDPVRSSDRRPAQYACAEYKS
jgi:hypothetical protein